MNPFNHTPYSVSEIDDYIENALDILDNDKKNWTQSYPDNDFWKKVVQGLAKEDELSWRDNYDEYLAEFSKNKTYIDKTAFLSDDYKVSKLGFDYDEELKLLMERMDK